MDTSQTPSPSHDSEKSPLRQPPAKAKSNKAENYSGPQRNDHQESSSAKQLSPSGSKGLYIAFAVGGVVVGIAFSFLTL